MLVREGKYHLALVPAMHIIVSHHLGISEVMPTVTTDALPP